MRYLGLIGVVAAGLVAAATAQAARDDQAREDYVRAPMPPGFQDSSQLAPQFDLSAPSLSQA